MKAEEANRKPERLAYWYLRLNGFLLLENFIVHPDRGRQQRTDADLLGVRFKHRAENMVRPMKDDPIISDCTTTLNVVIVEVKRGLCDLNGPWTRKEDENIQRILSSIGCLHQKKIKGAAKSLYGDGYYNNGDITCRLIAIGERKNTGIPIPGVPQILFNDIIPFIYTRFSDYNREKSSIGNWTEDGKVLRKLKNETNTKEEYIQKVREYFKLENSERGNIA